MFDGPHTVSNWQLIGTLPVRTTFDYERRKNAKRLASTTKKNLAICILMFEEETFLQMTWRFAFLSQCKECSGRICKKMLGKAQTFCPTSYISEPETRRSISGIQHLSQIAIVFVMGYAM